MDARTSAIFPFLTWNYLFGKILVKKNQTCEFKLKFGTYTNSNMQNSMVMFTFSVLDWKQPFWANLVQKKKFVSLDWNLVLTSSHKIFETNSSFHVKQRTMGKIQFLFFKSFLLALTKFLIWQGDWVLGYHSIKCRYSPDSIGK